MPALAARMIARAYCSVCSSPVMNRLSQEWIREAMASK